MLSLKTLVKGYYFPFYAYCVFYCLLTFVSGQQYYFAPYLFFASLWCVIMYRSKKRSTPNLFIPLIIMCFLTIVFSINYVWFIHRICPYYQYLPFSLLPYVTLFVFYNFACDNRINVEVIKLFFLLFFIVAILKFIHTRTLYDDIFSDYRQINAFYPILMSLPLLFLYKNKLINIFTILAAFLVCLISLKRSATLCVSLIGICFIYKEFFLSKRGKFASILIILILSFLIVKYFDYILADSIDRLLVRFDNIESDGGSGRFDIINRFFRDDIWDGALILGNGFFGYHNKYPDLTASHNDLIEIYYSLGIIGFIAYLSFIWKYFKVSAFSILNNSDYQNSYVSAFIILLIYIFAGGVFSFVELSLPFFSFLGTIQAVKFKNTR